MCSSLVGIKRELFPRDAPEIEKKRNNTSFDSGNTMFYNYSDLSTKTDAKHRYCVQLSCLRKSLCLLEVF